MAERLEATRDELEEQNAQLRESERLKSDLVNTVSHELRTPLSGVIGLHEAPAHARVRPRDAAPLPRASSTRRRAGCRTCSTTSSTSAESRRAASSARKSSWTWPLSCAKKRSSTASRARSTSVAVEIDHAPLAVIGNPDRLRQVIGNLISNAIKYSPQGGVVEVSADRENGCVRVEVRDAGHGHPAQPAAADLYEILPRRRPCKRYNGHGSRPRGVARYRGVATGVASASRAPRARERRSSSSSPE